MARILVVDDEEAIRALVKRILVSEGHDVTTASDGAEALKLVERQPVDLVITDLLMPGQEGVATITQLRKRFPDIGIIAMSGGGIVSAAQYLELARALGAHQILAKPFARDELLKLVAAAVAPAKPE